MGFYSDPGISFPRKWESSKQAFLIRNLFYWIPVFTGMGNGRVYEAREFTCWFWLGQVRN